jgi:hypothetical protein
LEKIMGKKDNRRSPKMLRKRAQRRLKARTARKIAEAKAAAAK